ncbi:MAG: DUF4011 domain-containing protein [bacterium]|nr:DUF4011 domain-containing protein [bacterium]
MDNRTGELLIKLRKRLLDLTNRNNLINFKFTEKSNKIVGIVDKLPNKVFDNLVKDKRLQLVCLPKPTKEAAEYYETEIEDLTEVQVADFNKINIDYEVPSNFEYKDEKKLDEKLQTRLFAKQLEKKLLLLEREARRFIEEKGVNSLYLSLGFLKYFDVNNSNDPKYAPLFMIPVSLTKGSFNLRNECHKFTIFYTGRDIIVNVSLKHKLKDNFDLDLPDIDFNDTPEDYFNKVAKILNLNLGDSRWELKRYIRLSLLHFSSLLLYEDINPANLLFEENELIENLLLGKSVENCLDNSEELENVKNYSKEFPIIVNADSSQYNSIETALSGKSLTIEGPPGTGKSQTITNMIAILLYMGKKVLFVSEKQAALNVVLSKLRNVGLDKFCLKIHSDKTTKKEFFADLEKRMNDTVSYDNFNHSSCLSKYDEAKTKLNNIYKLLNSTNTKLNLTYKQILCKSTYLDEKYPLSIDLQSKIISECDTSLDAESLNILFECLCEYVNSYKILKEYAANNDLIWDKVSNINLSRYKWDELITILHKFKNYLSSVSEINYPFKTCSNYLSNFSIDDLAGISDFYLKLTGEYSEKCIDWNFVSCYNEKIILLADKFITLSDECNSSFKNISCDSGQITCTPSNIHILKRLHQFNVKNFSHDMIVSIEYLDITIDTLDRLISNSKEIDSVILYLYEILHLERDFTFNNFIFAAKLVSIFKRCPFEAWEFRNELSSDDFLYFFNKALEQYNSLQSCFKELNGQVDLSILNSKELADDIIDHKLSKGLFSAFNKNYRKAIKLYKIIFKSQLSHEEKIGLLKKASSYFNDVNEYYENKSFNNNLGDFFTGIKTDFVTGGAFIKWIDDLNNLLTTVKPDRIDLTVQQILSLSYKSLSTLNKKAEHIDTLSFLEELSDNILIPKDVRINVHEELVKLQKFLSIYKRNLASIEFRNISIEKLRIFIAKLNELEDISFEFCDTYKIDMFDEYRKKWSDHQLNVVLDNFKFMSQLNKAPDLIKALPDWIIKSKEAFNKMYSFCSDIENAVKKCSSYLHDIYNIVGDTFNGSLNSGQAIKFINDRLSEYVNDKQGFDIRIKFIKERAEFLKYNLNSIVDAVEKNMIEPDEAPKCFEKVFFHKLALEIIEGNQVLREFDRTKYRKQVNDLVQNDNEVIISNSNMIADKLKDVSLPIGNKVGKIKELTELSLINHVLAHRKTRLSLKHIFDNASQTISSLKPCFMMGPFSVPNFLKNEKQFDVVIIDEASQVYCEHALGAIARSKQAIIVGDSNQLPPTPFFRKETGIEKLEDLYAVDESDSVLQLASDNFSSNVGLKWHYRSNHESLINFSNHEFYKNKLLLFPSPYSKHPSYGLKFKYIPTHGYNSGQNVPEAREVVKNIIEHYQYTPKHSLGVATINKEQRNLIEDLLDEELLNYPTIRKYIESRNVSEPFFIKNLENVQGDERDVIFVSVTYGPNLTTGKTSSNFGPINNTSGWKRLNVLFTRSKNKMIVFSSMKSSDINLSNSSSYGARVFKNYLHFAETGIILDEKFTGKEPDSEFEIQVIDKLKGHNFTCVPQYGVAGYFIDIAVKHPNKPGEFILGIECDGATYHSSQSARDRDKIREAVLNDKGWKIHRIWSTDWFQNSDSEFDVLLKKLEKVLEENKSDEKNYVPEFPEQELEQIDKNIIQDIDFSTTEVKEEAGTDVMQDEFPLATEEDDLFNNNYSEPEHVYESEPEIQQIFDEDTIKTSDTKSRTFTIADAEEAIMKIKNSEDYIKCEEGYCDIFEDDVLKEILIRKPTSLFEWVNKIDLDIRETVDPDQFELYEDSIFEIMSKINT